MKYVDVVTSFVNRHPLYLFAILLQFSSVVFVDDDNVYSVNDWIGLFMYLLGTALMICPLHYKSYRILYNIYSRFPKWLQLYPPSIPRYLRRIYKNPVKWNTVDILAVSDLFDRHVSCSHWCEHNSIGRYYIGPTDIKRDVITSLAFKIYFEDASDALMFKLSNA